MKLYRQVPVTERLPEKEGWYHTDEALAKFERNIFYEPIINHEVDSNLSPISPSYWLEEFSLPTEEEIIDNAEVRYPVIRHRYPDNSPYVGSKKTFIHGANYILNLIKNK